MKIGNIICWSGYGWDIVSKNGSNVDEPPKILFKPICYWRIKTITNG